MPEALIPTFILYSCVSAITPGPANLCSLAAAMTYGRQRALLQWRGIFLGFGLVAVAGSLAGVSLKKFFQKYQKSLNVAMAASLAYCATSILRM